MVRTVRLKRGLQVTLFSSILAPVVALASGQLAPAAALLLLSVVCGLVTGAVYNPNSKLNSETACERARSSSGIALPVLDQGQGITDEALQRELFSCLRKAMLSMAGIDGHIDPSEIMAISRLYREHTDERIDVATLESEAQRVMGQHDRMLNGLHCLAPYLEDNDKTEFLKAAAAIAAADGRIDKSEKELMHSIAATLNVSLAEADRILTGFAAPSGKFR
jgi:uncharacterized tellurite resistance protein B-like protein